MVHSFIIYEKNENNFSNDDDVLFVLNRLKNVFSNNLILKIGQNIKFDILVLKNYGIKVNGPFFDTMIVAHLINPTSKSISLNSLSVEFLNYEMMLIEDLIGKGQNKITMDQIALKTVAFYATEDADITYQLFLIFEKKLKKMDLYKIFNKIEIPLIDVLIEMEHHGTYVDVKFLKNISSKIHKKLVDLKDRIFNISGKEFNINSTQQLANILFDILNLPMVKKRSTAEDVLIQLSNKHELPKYLLDYRKYNKLKNTYLDALPEWVHKDWQNSYNLQSDNCYNR